MPQEHRHVIWSNYDLDYKDWKDDLEENYPDLSDDERYMLMHDINSGYLDDERMNLNIQLAQPIIVVGDLGLWNGRHMGYKEITSGNIRDCLFSDTDYSTWYVDKNGDMRCDAVHHDGTNHYLYRTYNVTTHNSCQNVHIIKNRPGKPGLPGFMPRYTGTAKRITHVNATRKNAAFLGSTLHFGPMA